MLLRVLIKGTSASEKEVLRVDVQVSDIDGATGIKPPI